MDFLLDFEMRTLVMFAFLSMPWVSAQNGRSSQQHQQPEHKGNGWDIRLAVPGDPGSDYPTLGVIPRTSFSCAGREPGYYADLETNCQVFRVCTVGSTYGFQSFLCPNGTLFNQAVFVCDWWMHVNCEKQQQFFNNNIEKFGNLKLGPELMKDIKKMLTHSVRNPYDKTESKGNLVIMQQYKPPSGQLFPNGALLASPERAPSNVYVPAKQIQQNFGQSVLSTSDNTFVASTPSPQYIPAAFNTVQPTRQTETFQRRRQNGQYLQNNRLYPTSDNKENIISNAQAGRLTQSRNVVSSYNNGNLNSQISRPIQNFIQRNTKHSQKQISNIGTMQYYNSQNGVGFQKQLNQQNSRYSENITPSQSNNGQPTEIGLSFTKQLYNYNLNQNNRPQTTKPISQFSNEIIGQVDTEAKQNLVSNDDLPSTVLSKTVKFTKIIQGPKPGNPKSRITFKTWIAKPSKSAKLIGEPTPYTYNRPTEPNNEIPIDQHTTPYIRDTPSTLDNLGKLISHPLIKPYIYNKPTTATKLILSTNREKQPISTRPTLSEPLITTSTITSSTKNSRFYLAPTTFKPATKYYTHENSENLRRQYLTPHSTSQTVDVHNAQLRAAATTPSPVFISPNVAPNQNLNKPSFSIIKHSHINAYNNLTFADILTKEKLDITVNDIVKDTSNLLKTASPEEFGRISQEPNTDKYLTSNSNSNESKETSSSHRPILPSRSSRIIPSPSTDLEPPFESHNNKNVNQLSNLPFFKEPNIPTIERTVSLKITIPEKLATYLFKNQSDSAYDRLEILNTGSSNYLVLTNKLTKPTIPSFIPIGRLIVDKNSSVSDSQALVFSFLADSINVAKEYSNLAQQSVLPAPSQPQFQNVNNEELSRITNTIAQLTSSQYTQNNNFNNNINREKIASPPQLTTNSPIQNIDIRKYSNSNTQNQPQHIQNAQYKLESSQLNNQGEYMSTIQNNINRGNLNVSTSTTQNPIFSGQLYQLPVTDVTSQIHNSQSSERLVQSKNVLRQNTEVTDLHQSVNRNVNNNNIEKPLSAKVEIMQSQSLPVVRPAKLQIAPNDEVNSLNSQDNSAPFLFDNFIDTSNGISAQLQDKIIGTIPHPSENNKFVTYKKDQSYYVYTKLNNNVLGQNIQTNGVNTQSTSVAGQKNANLRQSNNANNLISFQFLPSVSYQLENEKDQQEILNTFKINNFENHQETETSNEGYQIQNSNQRQDTQVSDVDYSVDHTSARVTQDLYKGNNVLYDGPSSYFASQVPVDIIKTRQFIQNNNNIRGRLEEFDDIGENNNGYPRVTPARRFSY